MSKKRTTEAPSRLARWIVGRLSVVSLSDGSPLITKILLNATLIAIVLLFLLLCVSYFLLGNENVAPRLVLAIGAVMYLCGVEWVYRTGNVRRAAKFLIAFYLFLSTMVLAGWGINAPIGILTLGFVILLTGIMLGARSIIPSTIITIAVLLAIQVGGTISILKPDLSSLSKPSSYFDVVSYTVVFSVFALVSWLSGRQMEEALQRALEAEAALQKERDLLADRLKEQTIKLRESQLAEMNQLYRFAELGQLSTVTMHDLANHLNVLALDLDDIQQRSHSSEALERAKESLSYLDAMVAEVRQQIYEDASPREFDAIALIKDMAPLFSKLTQRKSVRFDYTVSPRKATVKVMGDPLRLAQVVKVLVTNAIEAYDHSSLPDKRVAITITKQSSKVRISVCDWGVGITKQQRTRIFHAFESTKPNGMGIGLFIAKKMVETHFNGTLKLARAADCTEFIIELPLQLQRKTHS